MKKRIPLLVVAGLALAALLVSEVRREHADVSPRSLLNFIADTQRESTRLPMRVTRLSDAEEIALGDQMASRYDPRVGPPEHLNDLARQLIQRVGSSLAIRAHRKLPYRFHLIADPELINAFALPGGHIFIGAGMLNMMETEDELAAVLGHEVIHVDRYHCAERVQVEARARNLPLGGLAALPIQIFQAGYAKTQEFEADHEGVHLAVRAGYSPYGALRMQEKFDGLRERYASVQAGSPQEEAVKVAALALRDYFRSHPLPQERIARIRSLIEQNGWQNLTATKPLGKIVYKP